MATTMRATNTSKSSIVYWVIGLALAVTAIFYLYNMRSSPTTTNTATPPAATSYEATPSDANPVYPDQNPNQSTQPGGTVDP